MAAALGCLAAATPAIPLDPIDARAKPHRQEALDQFELGCEVSQGCFHTLRLDDDEVVGDSIKSPTGADFITAGV